VKAVEDIFHGGRHMDKSVSVENAVAHIATVITLAELVISDPR
jgi:hypothetical protein